MISSSHLFSIPLTTRNIVRNIETLAKYLREYFKEVLRMYFKVHSMLESRLVRETSLYFGVLWPPWQQETVAFVGEAGKAEVIGNPLTRAAQP